MRYRERFPAGTFLGELVSGRVDVLGLVATGRHDEAARRGDELLGTLSGHLPDDRDAELPIGLLPIYVQGIGLLADLTVAAVAAGDTARAANLLRTVELVSARLGSAAEQMASIGVMYCEHNNPSLDGACLMVPPCPL